MWVGMHNPASVPRNDRPPDCRPIGAEFTAGAHNRLVTNFQAGALYRLMKEDERERLVANLAASFAEVRDQAVQWPAQGAMVDRCISYLAKAEKDYGARAVKAVKK